MKRISLIFICIALLASCVEKNGTAGEGTGSTLHEWVLSESVYAGGEGVIQWNGFMEDASLALVSGTSQKYDLKIGALTASGVIFYVPSSVPAGVYSVQLTQEGKTQELGSITVLAAEMPVRNISMPSSAAMGDEVLIKGIGFAEGAEIVLIDAEGAEYAPELNFVTEGVAFVVSEELYEGQYEVYLLQDGGSWMISSRFEVFKNIVIKELKSVSMYAPYMQGSQLLYTWEISKELPMTLVISEYLVEGEEVSLSAYDSYVSDDGVKFVLDHDGFESSNDVNMTYTRDAEGTVTLADVLIYGKSKTTAFTWSYDADGYLTEIASPTNSFRDLAYEEGNLTVFRNTAFEYGDPALVNHPNAPDVVWAYMSLMEKNDPFVYIPYLLGWYTKASALLPTVMLQPSASGTGTVSIGFSYVFDADGYVSEILWNEGNSEYKLVFDYAF